MVLVYTVGKFQELLCKRVDVRGEVWNLIDAHKILGKFTEKVLLGLRYTVEKNLGKVDTIYVDYSSIVCTL